MPLHTELALQCADRIEAAVIAGDLHPGDVLDDHEAFEGLPEAARAGAVAVLAYSGLVEHDGDRVRVRSVGQQEVMVVRATRRHLELGSLADVARQYRPGTEPLAIHAMAEAVEMAENARDDDDWDTMAMASVLFNLAVIDLTGNLASMRVMRGLSAIMRLSHHDDGVLRPRFDQFIADNRRIAQLLASGQITQAHEVLERHLLQLEEPPA